MSGEERERRPLVLNVNDAEAARYVTSRILEHAGFEVIEAASGEAALERIAREEPEIVVLDVKLPGIDGLEVCRRVREVPRRTPIKILHTSATYVELANKVQSLENGADGYLAQPFEAEELVATIRSLLRLNRAEHELLGKTRELGEADRRKDEFLAMLAHELRNPLAAIAATLPAFARRPPADAVERHAREVLERQVGHLGRLVSDLLDVARVTQGKIELKLEPVDLTRLLERVADQARPTKFNPREQALALSLPDTKVFVSGDSTRLEQIFSNLLDNASKYTQKRGAVHLALGVAMGSEGGMARVSVRDDGMGMSAATLPTIFGLFAQADVPLARSRGGLGIGLTVVRTLVELHHGRVSARSDGLGRGSEFEVELPVLRAEGFSARSPEPMTERLPVSRRVLLVEDSPDVRETMKDLLEIWGHQVFAAGDGAGALALAFAERPEVALVDIGLPDVDGYEIARRLRAEHGGTLTLIALTGYGSPEQKVRALANGFDHHLTKPVNAAELALLIDEARSERPSAEVRSA